MARLVLLLALLGPAAGEAFGQSNVSGRLVGPGGEPVGFANIVLIDTATKTLVKATLSEENGAFVLEDLPNGIVVLKTSHMGFQEHTSEPIALHGNKVVLNDVVLNPKATQLKETTVTAQRPFIEVKQDKLLVNVENSIVSAGSTVLEILARSPGVTVNQNEVISLKGKQGVLVMIDDKLVPVSGEELANMLKNLPSNQVSQIEIITNPSARYDAAGNAGIINIKTKRNKQMGFNGSVTGSVGHGLYPKANGGANLNYRNKKISAYTNYNRGYRQGFNELTLVRRFYTGQAFNSPFSSYDQLHDMKMRFNNHTASTGLDYNVGKRTTIGVNASGNANFHKSRSVVTSVERDTNRVKSAEFNTRNRSNSNWNNVTANANLRHAFDSAGHSFSMDADYARFWNSNDQNLTTNYYSAEGIPTAPTYVLDGDINGETQIHSVKADYTKPFGQTFKLELGAKASFVTSDNNMIFHDASNPAIPVLDTGKSQRYVYKENINAAYVNASFDVKKWSFQLGLRGEQPNVHAVQKNTGQTLDTTYTKLFPSLAVQHHFNQTHDLGVTLSRRIDRPTYWQLNPFRFYMDPTTFNEGNPKLGPQLTYSAELSHTFKQRFITSLTYSYTTDVIAEVLVPYPGNITVQTHRNIAEQFYYGASVSYPFQITKWWSNVTNANAYHSRYKTFLANTALNEGKPTFDVNTTNTFTLPRNASAEVSLFYQSEQLYGFMHVNPLWMLNFGVQKSMFNKRLTARLNVTDVFFKGYPSATSYYSNYNEDFVAKRDTRVATFSLTYRFGKTQGGPQRRRTGAEDELKRVQQQ
ncbi:MAG TPA: TonB-dependent receptor [Chitinophagales bacterium]|nr:TonB-dependent receptor [Chitinophagales bacterium]